MVAGWELGGIRIGDGFTPSLGFVPRPDVYRYDGGIDPWEVKRGYNIGPMDPTVLFSGRMVYQKGPDILIEAIPSILNYYGNAKFIFAGDGEMRAQAEQRAHQLGVAHADVRVKSAA